jgi:DNA-binding CsgD family transcriptional regulator/ketosteroid isomerase-like protein
VSISQNDNVSAADSPAAHVSLLQRWFDAYNAHDMDALCALTDPAVEVVPLDGAATAPPGTTYHGHEGLRTLFAAGFERFPQLRLRHGPPEFTGERATVELQFVLDDGVTPPQIRAAVGLYRFADGRIRRMSAHSRQRNRLHVDDRGRAATLSPREREVLSRLAEGRTIPEIADELVLSPLTIRTHVRNAKDKLRARTTAHAVAIALDEKVLDV